METSQGTEESRKGKVQARKRLLENPAKAMSDGAENGGDEFSRT